MISTILSIPVAAGMFVAMIPMAIVDAIMK